MYVQRLARMLKDHRADLPLTTAVILQYVAREYSVHPEWIMMLTMALEMRMLDMGAPRRNTKRVPRAKHISEA